MRLSRRALTSSLLAAGIAGSNPAAAQEGVRRGGTLVATLGANEPQAVYVPAGGGPSPTFSSSKVLERLATRRLDGTFEGELAESFTPSADCRFWTIKLRHGVTWHDGKPLTADDVVYSITEVWKKHAAPEWMVDFAGASASDAGTVSVTFGKPVPQFFFASLLSGSANYILPKHVYAGGDPTTHPANNAPIGTGPWKFKAWVRGSHIEYERNPSYWRQGLPYLDRLVLRFLREPAARAAAIEAGEIQIGVFNPLAIVDLKRLPGSRFAVTAQGYDDAAWATTLECNVRHPIFEKREVRQAIFCAIDRSLIAKTVYYGYARPGTSPVFSSNKTYFTDDIFKTELDPKRAGQLLDAAGYPKKAGGTRFELSLVAGGWFAENAKVAAIVAQGLKEVGVATDVAVPDRATALRRIYTDYDFDLAISNQANPCEPVPDTTRLYTSDGIRKGVPFRNASGFRSDAIDALVETIRVETDPARRKAQVAEFQKAVTEEASNLPLSERETITLASSRVQNHTMTSNTLAASWHDIWLS